MKALPPDDQSREKNNQKHRKRIKVMLTFFVLVLLGSLACALASLPRREAPTPSARRIPARYTQPEILVPEDRELLSDVRTSFIPTGAIALPPKNDLQEIVDRRSEGLQAGGNEIKKTMRFTRTEDKNEIFTNKRLKTILEDEVSQFRDAITNGDDIKYVNKRNDKESRIHNDDIRRIRRHESFVNLGDDEKGLRNRRETTINLTASSLVWQISPKSVNFTLDSEPLTWQEKNGKGPIDDVVDTFKSRSEKEDTVTAVEINDESQSFIGAQSFWTSRGDQDSIRKTQADLMMQHMDQTADPCVDFYQYACGNWATLNPIPADKAGFDTFEMLRENLDVVLKDLLSTKHDCEEKKVNNMPNQNLDNENNVLRNLQQDSSKTYTNCQEHLKKNTFESFVAADNANSHVNKITEDEMIPDYSKKRIKRHEKRIIELGLEKTEKFQNDGNKEKKSSAKKFTKRTVKRQAIDGVNTINNGNNNNLKEGATLKARYLYESCMNYEILEKRGHKPLLELLDSLGGWPLLQQDWNETNFDWLELMARLRLYNNDILLSEWVGPDIKNSDEFVIQFDQTSLGLPTRDYFLQPVNDVYLEAYKNYLIKISTLLGSTYENAVKNADDLIGFESRLAKITSGPEERRNVSELYQRLTIDELKHMVPKIDWQRYLSIVLNRNAKLNETVVIFALKYVQDLVILLEQTEPKTISNYLLWRFVRHRVNNLDDRFQEAKQRFYFILFGREQAPPRWKNCVTQVNSNMGMALGSMFVRRYFDENSKNDTLIMTREIQESFRELLNLTAWIDDDTKILAGEKVDAMMLRIGYPDFILNEDELNERYREVSIHPDTYFENTLNILKHLTKIEQARLGQPVNKTVWNTAPAVVNAYYSRNKNQIMFPAGILQPPFYHRYFPKSLNYGGIGVVIGHEITHGFDDKGRLFDKYGNLHRWWHDMAIEMFHNRAQCLIDQYGHYTVSEVSMAIDGLNTQGENIADNGGIKQAFRAYQRWLQYNDDKDELLPGLNATNTQLFFLNFAQVWCGAMRPEAMKNKLKTAVHSPGKFRVIGTLSNSEDFSKEYKCPSGSPMNPVKKCNVW